MQSFIEALNDYYERYNANVHRGIHALAERANGSLRLTTRQGIQYHGVLKGALKPVIAGVNQALLTTLAACDTASILTLSLDDLRFVPLHTPGRSQP